MEHPGRRSDQPSEYHGDADNLDLPLWVKAIGVLVVAGIIGGIVAAAFAG